MALNWVDDYGKHSITLSNNSLNLVAGNDFFDLTFNVDSVKYKNISGNLKSIAGVGISSRNHWATFTAGNLTIEFSNSGTDSSGPTRITCTANQPIFHSSIIGIEVYDYNRTLEIKFGGPSSLYVKSSSVHLDGSSSITSVTPYVLTFSRVGLGICSGIFSQSGGYGELIIT